MKKIYVLLFMVLLSAGTFAQIQNAQTARLRTPVSVPSPPFNTSRAATTSNIWLDYDSADSYNWGQTNSRFIWGMNKSYNTAAGDSFDYDVQNVIVRFDSLYDIYTQTGTDRNTVTNISIDSIYTVLGHSNFSGNNDTIILRIISLNGSRYPSPNSILWADTLVTDTSLSPNNNWLIATFQQWNPGKTIAAKGFGVEVEFHGDRTQDTCGFIASFHDHGSCGTNPGPTAGLSMFYPNSYAYWTEVGEVVPTNNLHAVDSLTNDDAWYDCNSDTKYTPGVDAENLLQNVKMLAFVTLNPVQGIKEDLRNTGIGLYQNSPNPASTITNIKYQLANSAKEVTLYVYDVVGNKVMEVNEGSKSSGNYLIQIDASKLAKGMYTYTLQADGGQLTRKMIVQ